MQLFFRKVATSDGPFPIREALNVSELVDDRPDVTVPFPRWRPIWSPLVWVKA